MAGRTPQEETITIKLSRLDLWQILEGMSSRQQEWQQTADWHSGKLTEFPQNFKECSNATEAQWIADNYSRILAIIEKQLQEQS
ncbi:MAG: hypothetical protein ACSHYB_17110 [Roseibacillus sp.]